MAATAFTKPAGRRDGRDLILKYCLPKKKLQSSSFAYRNTYFSEKYPNYQIMEFEKAVFFPTLEQNFKIKSEKE